MKRPDFFIVGAPKCGTTALFSYLREHPQVFTPPRSRKEPHWFAEDLPGLRCVDDEREYLSLFQNAGNRHRAVGEASVFYLFSDVAIERIRQFQPDARIIAMVREPVEAVYSYHSQLLYSLDESVVDFRTAWELQEVRGAGGPIPAECREPRILQYAEVFQMGHQIERLLNVFPREQVKVIPFDDFKTDTCGVYLDVLRFLGLDDVGQREFPIVNDNKVNRSRWLARLVSRPPEPLRRTMHMLKKTVGIHSFGIAASVRHFNNRTCRRQLLPEPFVSLLAQSYGNDVRKLEAVIGKNLTGWCAAKEPPSVMDFVRKD